MLNSFSRWWLWTYSWLQLIQIANFHWYRIINIQFFQPKIVCWVLALSIVCWTVFPCTDDLYTPCNCSQPGPMQSLKELRCKGESRSLGENIDLLTFASSTGGNITYWSWSQLKFHSLWSTDWQPRFAPHILYTIYVVHSAQTITRCIRPSNQSLQHAREYPCVLYEVYVRAILCWNRAFWLVSA